MEWGEIPTEHLEIVDFPADTNATAVILGDYGKVSFDMSYHVIHERHTRIKVLSSSGFELGDVRLPYYAAGREQRINNIRAQTINVNNDGSLQYHEVSRSDIRREDLDGNVEAYIFTMPALEVGSIIEYSYTVRSRNPMFLSSWEFQTSEPTLWSQFEVDIPNYLVYARMFHNSVPFNDYQVEENVLNPTIRDVRSTRYKWVVKDAPAIRSEPFITTTDDYLTRVEFQLNTIQIPGMVPQRFMENWEKLANDLETNRSFGRQSANRAIRRQVNELTDGVDDPLEKMKAIYDYVRLNIEWDGRRRVFSDEGIRRTFSRKTGNSSDIALLLRAMLDRAGLDAQPVLISTRNNGRIQQMYPGISQFNHVLILVSVDDENLFLLDATDRHRPYSLLPFNALTDQGLVINRGNPEWINIFNRQGYNNRSVVMADLAPDGTISGNMQLRDQGYSGYRKRRTIRNGSEDEYIQSLLTDIPNTIIESSSVDNLEDITENLVTNLAFTNHDHTIVSGDYMYFDPFLLNKINSNPFTLPNRTFPVDYGHPYDYQYTLSLSIPEGYEVAELPANQRLAFDDRSEFTRMMQYDFGRIQIVTRFRINQTEYAPELYEQLQTYYDEVIRINNEQIVLKKIAAETN